MQQRDGLRLWSAQEVESGATAELTGSIYDTLSGLVGWARAYLNNPHPELGREGVVCPYTKRSMVKELFLLAEPQHGAEAAQSRAAVLRYRDWYFDLAKELKDENRTFLAILIPFPDFKTDTPTPLDELQDSLKPEFIVHGLMIGEFHPLCDSPGLWNEEFRPLRSPVPLLVIRRMVPFDLPFLLDDQLQISSYLKHFASAIPEDLREELATKAYAGAGR